jgi:hypothetical protein
MPHQARDHAYHRPFVIRPSPFPTCGRSTPSPKSSFTRSRRKRLFSQATTFTARTPASSYLLQPSLAPCNSPATPRITVPRITGRLETANRDNAKRHPALRVLCGWWNQNAPEPATRCAGYASPWVRMREDENYWCAYNETPNAPMRSFMHDAKGQARIGHLVKGAKDFTFDALNGTGFRTYHVTGTKGFWRLGKYVDS